MKIKKERRFKVKYGYSVEDQVSIGENELAKALYAQRTGKPVYIGNVSIKGTNIISIAPHYHYHTGWNEWYEPKNGEDWKQIQRDCPDYNGVIEYHKNKLTEIMQSGNLKLLNNVEPMQMLDLPAHETPHQTQKMGV